MIRLLKNRLETKLLRIHLFSVFTTLRDHGLSLHSRP